MLNRRLLRVGFASLVVIVCAALGAPARAQMGPRGPRDTTTFKLEVGEQQVLPATGVKSYSEGTPGVIDVRLTGDASRFVVVGTNQGTTTLLMLMFDGTEKLYNFQVGNPAAAPALAAPANSLAVKPLATIRLDLYFVQIDRKSSLDVGMSVPAAVGFFNLDYGYNLVAGVAGNKTAVIGSQFQPQLDMAQSRGWAKLNRHVTVITTNGQPASFDSGGEFNTTAASSFGQSVLSIKFGSKLSVVPRYDVETGRIELKVTAEISDLAASGTAIPGRSVSSVQTVSNLALGESLAVGGLSSTTSSRTRTGLPWLSQIPVIGLLFGKQTDTSNDTENLVFISPSVVDPLKPARAREFLAGAIQQFNDYTGGGRPHGVFPGTPNALPAQRTAPPSGDR